MHESQKVSSRVGLWLSAVTAAAVFAFMGILFFSTVRSFLKVEDRSVLAGLDRVRSAIDREVERVAATAADYAAWDETYAFALKGDDGTYASANLQEESLGNIQIDLAVVFSAGGARIAVAGKDGLQLSPGIPARIDPSSVAFAPAAKRRDGLADIGGRPFVFASMPVSPSEGAGAPRGLLVFARELDAEMAAEISALAGTRVSFEAPSGSDRSVTRNGLLTPVTGRLALADSAGGPVLDAVTQEKRDIFAQGLKTIGFMSMLVLLVAVATGLGMRLVLERILIRPMRRLEKALSAEGELDEAFERELAALAERGDAVGQTARVIMAARDELRKQIDLQIDANERLETEVRARTGELVAANRELAVYKSVMQGTGEGVVITDIDGTIRQTNQAFRDMSGYDETELIGRNPRILKSDRQDDAFFEAMWSSIRSEGRWTGEIWNKGKNGSVYPVLLSVDTIKDERGEPSCYVGITADIGKLKKAEENLNRMAFYDSLTGLPNRALFMDRFKQALARAQRAGNRVALVYLDLDRFKHVNDSLGHHAGDELLSKTAERIQGQVRETDTVCRIGGDEFTVILESIGSSGDAAAVSRKIIASLKESFDIEGSEVFIGTSIGIAMFPYDGTDADELIKKADAAMYEAKEHGRGQLRFASGVSGLSSTRRLEMETRIRKGLDLKEFYLTFQPQVSAGGASIGSSSGIVGAEALVRWKPAGRSVVSPDAFIDVAEESGLIVPLGYFVLREACAEAKRWSLAGMPLQVSVNVSQMQFERGRIVEQVGQALSETGLDAKYLKLEITETLFTRDMDRMISIMNEIKSGGVSFAVDDFGTGYSSLRYIDRLPIDSLKIDKSFIDRIASRYDGGEIATAVVALARSFGLESIAEGVETEEQLDALRSRGCDAIQGYYVSKPLDSDDFRAFIAAKDLLAELEPPA